MYGLAQLKALARPYRAEIVTILFFGILVVLLYGISLVISGLIGGILIGTFGFGGVGFYFLMVYIANPGIIQKRVATLAKFIGSIYSGAERKFVEWDIEGTINLGSDGDYGLESPYDVEIEWQKRGDTSAIVEENKVVICLRKGDQQPENLARASIEYSRNGILPKVRHLLSEDVNTGINYCVSDSILKRNEEQDASRYLWEEYILPNIRDSTGHIDEDKPLTEIYYKLDDTRKGGLFGPVLLAEYEKLVNYGRPDESIQKETEGFLDFLENIATKERDVDVPLNFEDETISVRIVLAARGYITSPEPYIDRCKEGLAQYDSTYLLAVGKNIPIAEQAASEVSGLPGVDDFVSIHYKLDDDSSFGGSKEAYRARFESIKRGS